MTACIPCLHPEIRHDHADTGRVLFLYAGGQSAHDACSIKEPSHCDFSRRFKEYQDLAQLRFNFAGRKRALQMVIFIMSHNMLVHSCDAFGVRLPVSLQAQAAPK